MATKNSIGDYRRVSKEVWDKFCEYYEGCGPAITTVFVQVSFTARSLSLNKKLLTCGFVYLFAGCDVPRHRGV